jgi:hypothetical protein
MGYDSRLKIDFQLCGIFFSPEVVAKFGTSRPAEDMLFDASERTPQPGTRTVKQQFACVTDNLLCGIPTSNSKSNIGT